MQTLKQSAIAVVGAFALFGLGTGFAAAADVPAQPAVPEQAAVPPRRPAPVEASLSLCSAPVVYASSAAVVYTRYPPPRGCPRRYAYGLSPRVRRGLRLPGLSALCRYYALWRSRCITAIVGIEPRKVRAARSKLGRLVGDPSDGGLPADSRSSLRFGGTKQSPSQGMAAKSPRPSPGDGIIAGRSAEARMQTVHDPSLVSHYVTDAFYRELMRAVP